MTSPWKPSIPDHETLRLIGRGSYGEVWLARSALGALRAVKVVRRSSFDSDRPYLREFTGIQKFEPISRSHDGLVDILQVGLNESERFLYYVMELADDANREPGDAAEARPDNVAGYEPRTLASDGARRGPPPFLDAARLFMNLASATGHLHAHGLLHRDIKPSNVIYVRGVPKLADIGLVAEAGGSETFVGTEGFIPPEGPGTVSADLYALGKLMYEVATGRDRHEFPSLPLARDSAEKNRELMEINAVLLRCCAPRAADRYPTAASLQADLAVLQSGLSVRRMHAFEGRLRAARRLGAGAAAAAMIALAAVVLVKRQEDLAERNLRDSERLRLRAETAERAADDQLYTALLARAAAERRSRTAGARENALAALRQAAGMRPATPELRSELIAAMALPDFSVRRRWRTRADLLVPPCLSRNAALAAIPQQDGRVEIRRGDDDTLALELRPEGGALVWVGPFSFDGRFLETWHAGNRRQIFRVSDGARVFDTGTNAPDQRFLWVDGAAEFAVLSAEGLQLANMDTGKLRRLPAAGYRRAGFSPGGGLAALASGANDVVEIWDVGEGRPAASFSLGGRERPICFGWSPDLRRLAVGTSNHRVEIWRREGPTFVLEQSLKGHDAEVVSILWSPSGELLVSGSWDETLRLWNPREGREIARSTVGFVDVQFSDDGRRMTMVDWNSGEAVEADIHHQEVCKSLLESGGDDVKSPFSVQFTADSKWVVCDTHDGLRAYGADDGHEAGFRKSGALPNFVMLPPPGRCYVVQASGGLFLGRWAANAGGGLDLSAPEPVDPHQIAKLWPNEIPWVSVTDAAVSLARSDGSTTSLRESSGVTDAEISRDGRWVAATFDLTASLWSTAEGSPRRRLGSSRNYALAFSAGSEALFYADGGDLVRVSSATGAVEWRAHLTDQPSHTGSIRTSEDGRLVAAVMNRMSVSLVDPESGRLLATLQAPETRLLNDIAISPDGNLLAAATSTHVTQLWDLAKIRRELAALGVAW